MHIEGRNLLLIGIEAITEGRQVHEFPQAWWCQIVDRAEQGMAYALAMPVPPRH